MTIPCGCGTTLTERPAWKALEEHHRNIRAVHLRELFARDPGRGERLTLEAAGLYLDYSKNRITDETLTLLVRLAEDCGLRAGSTRMFSGERSTSRSSAPCCTSRCARRAARRSWSTARTSCPGCMPCSTGWRTLPIACAAANGRVTPASGSATSSTSASAAPTSGRSWPTRRSGTTATAASRSASSRTSTAPTSPKPSAISTRPRPSSSCRPRPSRRWRR